jgi:hypothetical protein
MKLHSAAHRSMKQRGNKKKPPRVSVLLSSPEYTQLEKMATKSERSMSWLGRYAVRRLLDDYAEKQLPLSLEMPKEE